ncbi:MAG: arsenical pump-driving ATPase [Bacteroidia bacterium]|nr:arsenical pump-driving ATPase [Bacteroidia bacterium]
MSDKFTKYLFFTGKGGVGKTSLACTTAIQIADQGKKVLLISTDPASNLEDVLGCAVLDKITSHKELSNLFTININPDSAADEYRERAVEPFKKSISDQEIHKIKEGLSGACTTEIASFDEFSRFITGEGNPENYDVIIFDTAPTGHTIRLLELPAAWDDFLDKNPGGASCIGPSTALKSSKDRYKKVITSLRDPKQTTFYLVSRAETASLKEANRTSIELKALGLANQKLLINGVYDAIDKSDELGIKMEAIAKKELSEMPDSLKILERADYPLLPYNILGVKKLRSLFNKDLQKTIIDNEISSEPESVNILSNLHELVDSLDAHSNSGLIMTMGKGGVGKTIVAASIATMLARRGHQVLLTTTDPAAHVKDFINQLNEVPKNLTVERIDPKVETKVYTDKIFEQKSKNLNEEAKKLLIEDLKSPCNEEVAVFNAFSKAINKAKRQFVVMDTAPTGHTLLLLDTTGKYHKEILKTTTLNPDRITTPYMTLQDGNFAKILLIALPETTPMREAEALQIDLKRAGIEPYGWVINQCLSAVKNLKDPLLKKRASNEGAIIKNIKENLSKRTYILPYLPEEKLLPAIISMYEKIEVNS